MKIKVTDLERGTSSTYEYSKKNWAKRWACMRDGLVICWVPKPLSKGQAIITSGRRWELV